MNAETDTACQVSVSITSSTVCNEQEASALFMWLNDVLEAAALQRGAQYVQTFGNIISGGSAWDVNAVDWSQFGWETLGAICWQALGNPLDVCDLSKICPALKP